MPALHTVYLSVNENKKSAASAFSLRAYGENNGLHLLKGIDQKLKQHKGLARIHKAKFAIPALQRQQGDKDVL